MKDSIGRFEGLDDWQVVCQLLPVGWQEEARRLGAMRRTRGIASAELLLRILLVHLAEGCSLKETATRVRTAGWCSLSPVALFKRLRASGKWLRWMAEQLWRKQAGPWAGPTTQRRLRAVDATTVQEPGATGTDWRVHFVVNVRDLNCDFLEVTDASGGETFRRVPIQVGDLIMGDRAYGTPAGVTHVAGAGGQVLVRMSLKNLPLYQPNGGKLSILRHLRALKVGRARQWPAEVRHGGKVIKGRLVAVKRSQSAAALARRRLKRKASKDQRKLSSKTLLAAGYIFIFTTMPTHEMTAAEVMELYRMRWQIEIAFKRMKSLLGLGHLPKYSDASSRAWLHGKLLVALLIERLLDEAEDYSPWGYRLDATAQPVA